MIRWKEISIPLLSAGPNLASVQTTSAGPIKNVKLVHRAWADGSSWSKLSPLLGATGLDVTAVQLPLTSLADDVSATQRAIAPEDGPVVLAGHSSGRGRYHRGR